MPSVLKAASAIYRLQRLPPSVRARAPHTPHTACSLYTHYGTRRAQKTLPILTRAATSTRTAKFENQKRYSRTSKTKADATRYNKGA